MEEKTLPILKILCRNLKLLRLHVCWDTSGRLN